MLCGLAIMILNLAFWMSETTQCDTAFATFSPHNMIRIGSSLAGGLLMICGVIEVSAYLPAFRAVFGVILLVAASASSQVSVRLLKSLSSDTAGGPAVIILLVLRAAGLVLFSSALFYRYWGTARNGQASTKSVSRSRQTPETVYDSFIRMLARISVLLGVVLWEFVDATSPVIITKYLRGGVLDGFMMLAAVLVVLRGNEVSIDRPRAGRVALGLGFVLLPFVESLIACDTHSLINGPLYSPTVVTPLAMTEFFGTALLATHWKTMAQQSKLQ
jgi:hypothetical protein